MNIFPHRIHFPYLSYHPVYSHFPVSYVYHIKPIYIHLLPKKPTSYQPFIHNSYNGNGIYTTPFYKHFNHIVTAKMWEN